MGDVLERLEGRQVREAAIEEVEDNVILMRAVPYGVETEIWPGLWESFTAGAFSRAGKDPARVKMWDSHGGDLIGHAREVEDRDNGVWITAAFSATNAAQDARTLAREGTLDRCSIEFQSSPRHMTVTTKGEETHVHHSRAHLLGVALVPHPAYEDATVVSVRDVLIARDREAALLRLRALTA